jgi:hypothetical protein
MANHTEYYKGEGGGFPQIQVMMSLMRSCMHVARLCTKSAPTMH